jgi:hypothetical protein
MAVFWAVAPCNLVEVYQRFRGTCCSIIRVVMIALMMEAARTSETPVSFYQTTRRNSPKGSHLHTRRRENLKSHIIFHTLCFILLQFTFSFYQQTIIIIPDINIMESSSE